MITVWRFGYEPDPCPLVGAGWRRVFWRFWWYDEGAAVDTLRRFALLYGVEVEPGETSRQLRARILDVHRTVDKRVRLRRYDD